MDPQATLERLRNAWIDHDTAEMHAAAMDLLNWIRKGGFIPTPDEPQLSALLWIAAGFIATDVANNLTNHGDIPQDADRMKA